MEGTKIAIFKGKKIRKIIYNNEWWFSVVDVVEALSCTERPRKYWFDLKKTFRRGLFSVVRKNRTTENRS